MDPLTFRKACLLVAFSVFIYPSFAKNEIYENKLSGVQLQPGAQLEVMDDKYSNMLSNPSWTEAYENKSVTNRIILAIDHSSVPFSDNDFSTTVELNISYQTWNGGEFTTNNTSKILRVNYEKGSLYYDKQVFEFIGGHHLLINVSSISGPVSNLVLKAEIDIDRYYIFNPAYIISPSSLRSNLASERGELVVEWDLIPGAEEYDLEWAHINNYLSDGAPTPPSTIEIDKDIFRFSSSRITTVKKSYSIPLIYDRGYIIYRIRGIGRNQESGFKLPVTGSWSYEPVTGDHLDPDVFHKILFEGHQGNLNWQGSISYAEEGKNKVAVNYFDGSMRNRQSVSKLNTEDKVVAGETIYDHQGRGVIQTLPAPIGRANIGYTENLNRNEAGEPYNRENFDIDKGDCIALPDPMSVDFNNIGGAANYYSPQNPNKEGHQGYLPDAQGFPFSQVEYTPDNTGRIRRQSGVGPDHALSSNHETKYFYGKPAQEELDRLFGADAGFSEHYKKQMVLDANGQISVSYVDMQGKVVATALAGEQPENMDRLSSSGVSETFTEDLFGKKTPTDISGPADRLSPDNLTKTLSKEVLVSDNARRYITYKISPEQYSQDCIIGETQTVCYDCVLDLTISFVDECGKDLLSPIGSNGSNSTTIGAFNTLCADTPDEVAYTDISTDLLQPGSYQLVRKLSINEDALDLYTEDFLARKNDCFLDFNYFLQDELTNIEFLICETTCEECLEDVGDYYQYSNPDCNPCLSEAEYDQLLATCNDLCEDDNVTCVNAYKAMIADVSPHGQYGLLMQSVSVSEDGVVSTPDQISPIDPGQFPLSVFNENNSLPVNGSGEGNWRFPDFQGQKYYFDEFGRIDYVDVYVLPDGVFLPEIVGQAVPANIELKPGQVIKVLPQQLKYIQDFILNWKPEWARSLVQYHPEYGYYDICVSMDDSHAFDVKMLRIDNITAAIRENLIPEGERPNPIDLDPFFQNKGFLVKMFMENAMNNYSGGESIWAMVNRAVNCPSSQVLTCNNCTDFVLIDSDAEWNMFKSLYISLKQKFVEYVVTNQAIDKKCFNGCIGENPFNISKNLKFYKHVDGGLFNSALFDRDQPCNIWDFKESYYKEKVKRFPISRDMIDLPELDIQSCYQEQPDDFASQGEVDFDIIECGEELMGLIESAEHKADVEFYERCGQCPLAHDLQILLEGIVRNGQLNASGFLLSCYPESEYPEFVPDLEEAINENLPGSGKIYWKRNSSSNSRELIINIVREGSGTGCELRLILPDNVYSINDIIDFCCLSYLPNPVLLPYQENRNFIIVASVKNSSGKIEKIKLEGSTSCLDISGCTFAPSCDLTDQAIAYQNLLNMLLLTELGSGDAPPLVSSSSVDLTQSPFVYIIDGMIKTGPVGENWTWQAEILEDNKLTGYIKDDQGNQCIIELVKPTLAFRFHDILSFNVMRVNKDHQDPEYNFIVTAEVQTVAGRVFVNLYGYSSCFLSGTCEIPIAPNPGL